LDLHFNLTGKIGSRAMETTGYEASWKEIKLNDVTFGSIIKFAYAGDVYIHMGLGQFIEIPSAGSWNFRTILKNKGDNPQVLVLTGWNDILPSGSLLAFAQCLVGTRSMPCMAKENDNESV